MNEVLLQFAFPKEDHRLDGKFTLSIQARSPSTFKLN